MGVVPDAGFELTPHGGRLTVISSTGKAGFV
jgi:hypothetical protein